LTPLNVIHFFRSPVGGLFRHVCDLIEGQSAHGLKIGVICDASTGGDWAAAKLAELTPHCTLGIHRLPMSRSLHWSDAGVVRKASAICRAVQPDIIHGHGAKGGAYSRLVARRTSAKTVYTPHGGALHYDKRKASGMVYFSVERFLRRYTGGVIFESAFSADTYADKIGAITCPHQVIHNGLHDFELAQRKLDDEHHDFLFIGELRKLKGLDVLLQAIHRLKVSRAFSLIIVGEGPDSAYFHSHVRKMGLQDVVTFSPPIFPAREAFAKAQCVVLPSLAESLPYIALEAVGASVPILATRVGGIPEIFGPHSGHLVTPNDPDAMASAMVTMMDDLDQAREFAGILHDRVRTLFLVDDMVSAITAFYRRVLE